MDQRQGKGEIIEMVKGAMMFLMTVILSISLFILGGFKDGLNDFKESVDSIEETIGNLNINMGKVITWQQGQVDKNQYVDERLRALEQRTKGRWTKEDHYNYSKDVSSRFETLIKTYEKRFENIESVMNKNP